MNLDVGVIFEVVMNDDEIGFKIILSKEVNMDV